MKQGDIVENVVTYVVTQIVDDAESVHTDGIQRKNRFLQGFFRQGIQPDGFRPTVR